MSSQRTLPYLVTPPLLWASNTVLGSLLVGWVPPMMLNAARWWVAFIFLAPFIWPTLRKWRLLFEHRRWVHLMWTGVLAIAAFNALQYLALETSSAINVTLVGSSAPIWMLGIGAVFYQQRVSRRQALGAAISILGVIVTLSRGSMQTLTQIEFVLGDLLILLAIATWSVYSWMLAKPPKSMTGKARPLWNWADYLGVQILFGLVWVSVTAGVEYALTDQRTVWNGWVIAAIIYIAVGPALIAYWCWGVAVVRAGPALSSFFANLIPVFTALLSAVLLRERPQAYHIVSFLLIVAGIVLANLGSLRPPSQDKNGDVVGDGTACEVSRRFDESFG